MRLPAPQTSLTDVATKTARNSSADSAARLQTCAKWLGYVEAQSYKRARKQEMIFNVFKRMKVDELRTVNNTLMQHAPELRDA